MDHVRNRLHADDEVDPNRKWVFLLAPGINFADLAGARLLTEEARRRRTMGGGMYLVGAQARLLRILIRDGDIEAIGRDRFFAHKGEALRDVYRRLDPEICRRCSVRTFHECQSALPNGELRQPVGSAANSNPEGSTS